MKFVLLNTESGRQVFVDATVVHHYWDEKFKLAYKAAKTTAVDMTKINSIQDFQALPAEKRLAALELNSLSRMWETFNLNTVIPDDEEKWVTDVYVADKLVKCKKQPVSTMSPPGPDKSQYLVPPAVVTKKRQRPPGKKHISTPVRFRSRSLKAHCEVLHIVSRSSTRLDHVIGTVIQIGDFENRVSIWSNEPDVKLDLPDLDQVRTIFKRWTQNDVELQEGFTKRKAVRNPDYSLHKQPLVEKFTACYDSKTGKLTHESGGSKTTWFLRKQIPVELIFRHD